MTRRKIRRLARSQAKLRRLRGQYPEKVLVRGPATTKLDVSEFMRLRRIRGPQRRREVRAMDRMTRRLKTYAFLLEAQEIIFNAIYNGARWAAG